MKQNRRYVGAAVAGLLALSGCSSSSIPQALSVYPGHVYAATNAAAGNAVVHYGRSSDGTLRYLATVPTGGKGVGAFSVLDGSASADPLSSQNSLVLSSDHSKLFVVNAASNTVSAFTISGSGDLHLVGTYPSRGNKPITLAAHGSVLYVGHAAPNTSNDQLFGFTINTDGSLTAIPSAHYGTTGSTPLFSLALSPGGRFLAATESATGKIEVYPVNADGSLGAEAINTSLNAGPTGAVFADDTHLIISETHAGAANGASVSSYTVSASGSLTPQSSGIADQQTASCWITLTPNGRYLISSNTGSSTISSFSVGAAASLGLLQAIATPNFVATPTSGPIDAATSADSRFFYQGYSSIGVIGAFAIQSDGSLVSVNGDGGNLPLTGSQGVAAF